MRPICFFISILSLCMPFLLSAQTVKLKQNETFVSLEIKLDRLVQTANGVNLYGKVKQKQNFSYNISFQGCAILPENIEKIPGNLQEWNDNKKTPQEIQSVSDQKDDKFIISFPNLKIIDISNFDLIIGNVLDRPKTPIIFKDIKLPSK